MTGSNAKLSKRTHFAPVLATDRLPPSFLAVTSHAINEHASPSIGERAAAAKFCLLHINVNVAGSTAEEMMTPCLVSDCQTGSYIPRVIIPSSSIDSP